MYIYLFICRGRERDSQLKYVEQRHIQQWFLKDLQHRSHRPLMRSRCRIHRNYWRLIHSDRMCCRTSWKISEQENSPDSIN